MTSVEEDSLQLKKLFVKGLILLLIFSTTDLGYLLKTLFKYNMALSTEDKLQYNFFPVASGQIQFRVKAGHDAHIALTMGPSEGDPMYEVFLGGWNNARSVIRKNRSKPEVAEADTPGILTESDFRGFWIRWYNGNLDVGRENEPNPFLSYTDPQPFGIGYFGVCTGWGATGEWIIEGRCIAGYFGDAPPSAPAAYMQPPMQGGASCWVDASGGVVPPGALAGGQDGEPLFVARARHEGALIPGKLKPSHCVCYIAWGGAEHGKPEYQVLCGSSGTWVPTSGGNVPPNALPAGESEDGEPLFVGRVNHEGTLSIGKVQASHGVLYIPFGGAEVAFPDYEILLQ
ncbi:uncharacterized protein LOC124184630 isoform X3 [Neodiprion fabricii]|uniref:uncharacterized protein LOC124184630 isoform X3 n=1 Tax=Neodiprion fabricii TaxID=2872261 RepID=UPI001ED8C3CF|nr:uncharacterized protein LOC124184630 isoform X3 [Neodiprion fabricii]